MPAQGKVNPGWIPSARIWSVPNAMTMKPQKMKKWMTPTRSLKSFLCPKTRPTKPSGAGDRAVEAPFGAADHDVLHPTGHRVGEDRQGDHEDHNEDRAVDSHRKTIPRFSSRC